MTDASVTGSRSGFQFTGVCTIVQHGIPGGRATKESEKWWVGTPKETLASREAGACREANRDGPASHCPAPNLSHTRLAGEGQERRTDVVLACRLPAFWLIVLQTAAPSKGLPDGRVSAAVLRRPAGPTPQETLPGLHTRDH